MVNPKSKPARRNLNFLKGSLVQYREVDDKKRVDKEWKNGFIAYDISRDTRFGYSQRAHFASIVNEKFICRPDLWEHNYVDIFLTDVPNRLRHMPPPMKQEKDPELEPESEDSKYSGADVAISMLSLEKAVKEPATEDPNGAGATIVDILVKKEPACEPEPVLEKAKSDGAGATISGNLIEKEPELAPDEPESYRAGAAIKTTF